AGPGFINFYLKDEWLAAAMNQVLEMGEKFGENTSLAGERINLEYVSANPTGPMHMGNARGGALGDSLARAMAASGAEVTREFYLNDAGNQIEKLGSSLYARLMGDEVPEDGYHGKDIAELAERFRKLTVDSRQSTVEELVDFAIKENLANIKRILANYRVEYDVWFNESELHKGAINEILEKLKAGGAAYEQDGALWFKTGEEKDEVLVRANGTPTYFAADIAYHYNKLVTREFDKAINVWGADHHGHIARLTRAMEILGVKPDSLQVITVQLVRLMQGETVERMSKRKGEVITLESLIDEIGVDPARFFFNMRQSNTHFDFDLDLAVEQSSNNPVYYVQYAHARIHSILSNVVDSSQLTVVSGQMCKPEHETEKELAKKIAAFPCEVEMVARTLEPSRLTHYATDLAACFHSFYGACRVLDENEGIRASRLCLAQATRQTLNNVLRMLGVSAPKQM
ncbi:MAG: arginine--tRNA ligase, partial [Oscillospiraceae bacterium]|nr:arginine--tRNA ligase [Oscillospiraceae bacterium]